MQKLKDQMADQKRRFDSLESRLVRIEQKNEITPGQYQRFSSSTANRQLTPPPLASPPLTLPPSASSLVGSVVATLESSILEIRGGLIPLCCNFECVDVVIIFESWPTWRQALTKSRGFNCVAA